MKDDNYIVIQGWMVNRLGLKGNELNIYALIYGFSQDGESRFTGSINYIKESLKLGRTTVIDILSSLVKKGLIIKDSKVINSITFNEYRVNLGSTESGPPVQNPDLGSTESGLLGGTDSGPNNTNTNNINKKYVFFEWFWDTYDKKVGKEDVLKKVLKLKNQDIKKIESSLEDFIKSKPEKKFRPNPMTYLNQKKWNDEIITSEETKGNRQTLNADQLEISKGW